MVPLPASSSRSVRDCCLAHDPLRVIRVMNLDAFDVQREVASLIGSFAVVAVIKLPSLLIVKAMSKVSSSLRRNRVKGGRHFFARRRGTGTPIGTVFIASAVRMNPPWANRQRGRDEYGPYRRFSGSTQQDDAHPTHWPNLTEESPPRGAFDMYHCENPGSGHIARNAEGF